MTNPIRILLADDHPIVRDGLRAILSTQPDFEVVGEASNGAETVQQILQLRPDVALLDLGMPVVDGVEALKRLREANAETRVIAFTAFDTDERIVAAVRAGAQGYLLKGAPRDEIFHAIRVVSAGGSLLQPVVASKLMQHLNPQPDELTPRELEVLQCLARGHSNKEIAATLFITERTVKFHLSSIMGKLGASNRTEVVTIAMQRGLIKLSEQ
jgi:DNA-binding NarL/FixJ family response regulator